MLPPMVPIRQSLDVERLHDVTGAMRQTLCKLELAQKVTPGMRVGIPVGSRGIRDIVAIVREAARFVKALGAQPVVVAAMGSHGGGTVEGQLHILHSLGIREESIGAPVLGSVDAEEVGRTADGTPVYFDRVLLGCDGLLVINRVKPHTSFRGPLESGLVKMLVVGCGKPVGARQFHRFGAAELGSRLVEMGQILVNRLPILGGIAILENGREETADLVPVYPETFIQQEQEILERARQLLPRLPVRDLDLLVVDEMGKNISGTGMDTNVIGRIGLPGVPDAGPRVKRVVVLDLTAESHGNANGMGLADLVTRRFASKVDFNATYLNALTTTFVERAKLPITLESDREVVETALRTIGSPPSPRIIRIRNTLELERMLVSPAVLQELAGRPDIQVESDPRPWGFDAAGNLF